EQTGRSSFGAARTSLGPFRQSAALARAQCPGKLGVDGQRSRQLDPIALLELRRCIRAAAKDRKSELVSIERVPSQEPLALDGFCDRRAGRKLEGDDVLDLGSRPHDRHVHARLVYTASARCVNASTKVLAIWLKTGPTTFSSTCEANSYASSNSTLQPSGAS